MGICCALVIGLADPKRRFEAHFKTSAVKGGGKGGEKVLFRLKEREELEHLRHLVAELKPLAAKAALLEQQNAEKDARIAEKEARHAELVARHAELVARIAELENQKTPSQPEEQ